MDDPSGPSFNDLTMGGLWAMMEADIVLDQDWLTPSEQFAWIMFGAAVQYEGCWGEG